jgi:hypothetical protein
MPGRLTSWIIQAQADPRLARFPFMWHYLADLDSRRSPWGTLIKGTRVLVLAPDIR